jgi:hypothetical protein
MNPSAFAVCARLMAIVFGCVTLHVLMSLGALMVPATQTTRVRQCIGALLLGNITLTHYGQVGNLDGPYLAWSSLALLEIACALQAGEPRRLYRFAVYAALAVGIKDQAYAIFLFSVPAACMLGVTQLTQRYPMHRMLRVVAQAALLAIVRLLLLDAAPFNPHGFVKRLRFLLSPASQDHAYCTRNIAGRVRLLRDMFESRPANYYPAPVWLLLLAGLLLAFDLVNEPDLTQQRDGGTVWTGGRSVERATWGMCKLHRHVAKRGPFVHVGRQQPGEVDHEPCDLAVCGLGEGHGTHLSVLALDLAARDPDALEDSDGAGTQPWDERGDRSRRNQNRQERSGAHSQKELEPSDLYQVDVPVPKPSR